MKILVLEPYQTIQGPLPRIVPLLANALRAAGCHVGTEYWGKHEELERPTQKVFGRLADLATVGRRLARDKFDVLYVPTAHDWKTISRDLPLLTAARRLVRARVLHIHGSQLVSLVGPRQTLFQRASHALFWSTTAVIVSSHEERRALATFAPTTPFFVADNAYERPVVAPAPSAVSSWHVPAGLPILFFAARLIAEKGIRELLAAMRIVLRTTPCHLLIAGVGPLENEVQAALRDPEIGNSISWVRYLDRAALEQAYASATLFVLPTYHIEGFPAVVQDALGHGLPIITTPIRGLADHIVDGVHGKLVPHRNVEALADGIVTLLSDQPGLQRIRDANRAKAEEFAASRIVGQYLRIFEQALERGTH